MRLRLHILLFPYMLLIELISTRMDYVITAFAWLLKMHVVFYVICFRLHIFTFDNMLLSERMSMRMDYVTTAFVGFLKMHVVF